MSTVISFNRKTLWTFTFSKGEGVAVFDSWLKNCYDDEDFRKALTTPHRR